MTIVKFRNDGHRRCPDIGPAGVQCVERKKKSEHPALHRDGLIMWGRPFGGAGGQADGLAVDPAVELAEWWREQAESEIGPTVDKAIEYGSTDLIDIGLMLGRTMGRALQEEEAAELGVFFYLIGKIARWQSSIERGERPSDDTLFDIGVYVRMAQRIRKSGGWPGTEET